MSWEREIALEYSLSTDQIDKFRALLENLSRVSDRNLTAVTGEDNIVDFHFRDSLSLLAFKELEDPSNIVDVGSGAGFPGLPLAIACPEKSFYLLEANARKCEFIDDSAKLLKIPNVSALKYRAEEAARGEYRDFFDLAIARAVGSLPLVLEYTLPLLKVGGIALLQRGSREDDDESTAAAVSDILGGRLDRIEPVKPYSSSKNRHVWVFSKMQPTPQRFPRRTGIPKKRPLSQ